MSISLRAALRGCALWFAAFAMATCVASAALAQDVGGAAQPSGDATPPPTADRLIRVESVVVSPLDGHGASEARIALRVLEGWHVNAHKPNEDFLVPTVLSILARPGVSVGAIRYPEAKSAKLGFSDTPLAVYEGRFEIVVPFTVRAIETGGTTARALRGLLRFQACNDQICLPPASVPVTVLLPDLAAAALRESTVALVAVPDSVPAAAGPIATGPPAGRASPGAGSNLVTRWFDERGSLLAFVFIFLMGLALNLTPCVYPMMGVTVSLFGAGSRGAGRAQSSGLALHALPKAIVYVLGIALMYSTLGVVAALTGGLFGGWLASPWVLAGIGALLFAMALSMFGLYELQVPGALVAKLGGAAGASMFGTFLAGLLVGVFAAPCIGPPIIALLAHVGAKGDPVFGFWAFFVLSLGLGTPYLVLGVSSGLLTRLPRSGSWMDWVKHLFGVILLAVAAFYLCLAFAPSKLGWVVPLSLFLGGLYLGFLEPTGRDRPAFRRFKWGLGTLAIVAAALVAFRPAPATVTWDAYSETALASARVAGKPVLLDFGAEWCVPCHELDQITFADAAVVRESQDFVRLKVDLTRFDAPQSQELRQRFDVAGVPTIVFLGPDGAEILSARVVGFLGAKPFLERVRAVRRASNLAERRP